jgi:hypothetical protein
LCSEQKKAAFYFNIYALVVESFLIHFILFVGGMANMPSYVSLVLFQKQIKNLPDMQGGLLCRSPGFLAAL